MRDARAVLQDPKKLQEAKTCHETAESYEAAAQTLNKRWGTNLTGSKLRHALLRAFSVRTASKGKTKCKNADTYRAQREPKCGPCDICAEKWEAAERYRARVGSDLEPLPTGYKMPGSTSWKRGEMDAQKKQEYSANMGKVADALHRMEDGGITDPHLARYVSNLAEDERRFVNRRRARSVSLALARDTLAQRQLFELADRYFKGRITPSGYAKKTASSIVKRTANLHLSDLHIGSRLLAVENPEPYGGKEEARRLAHVILEAVEFKTQYRNHTSLNLLLNGDVIDGYLQHQQYLMDNAALAEMKLAFLKYMAQALQLLSSSYPSVHVVCEPGNHGRNKLIHEGRATSWKWDGIEWELYKILEMMSSDLTNVRWSVPKAPAVVVPVFNKNMLVTHGDTEMDLKDPDSGGHTIEKEFNRINAGMVYKAKIDLLIYGHFHKPRVMPFKAGTAVANGALVPPNGHARSNGWDSRCGQWLWESVPDFIWGDNRFVEVGPKQDADASLDKIITPFPYET